MKYSIPLAVVFLVLGINLFASGSHEKQLDIYYTASLNGNLDGCECKSHPRSGLVKRAVYLHDIDKNNSLILDVGDILDVYPDELLSDYILKSYQDLGYDAIAVGDQEFSNGIKYLQNKITQYPLLSNNLNILQGNDISERITAQPMLISRAGYKIAILSVTDPEVFRFYPADITESIEIEDPSFVVSNLLKESSVLKADLRVLLFHGSLKIARELAKTNSSLNIIVAGHEQQTINGELIGDTIIVSPGAEGNMLGHLKVIPEGKKPIFSNSFIKFDYMTDPDDSTIRAMIDEYTRVMTEKLKTD